MRTGVLVLGISIAVIGFILFIMGYNTVQEYQTSLGQVGRILIPSLKEKYQNAMVMEVVGGVLLLIGIIVSVAGTVSKEREEVKRVITKLNTLPIKSEIHKSDFPKVSESSKETSKFNSISNNTEIIYCPYCGSENPPESKFCIHCGRNVSEIHSIKECPKCGSNDLNVEILSMYGKYGAGNIYRFVAVICQKCGYTELYFKEKSRW